MTHLCVPIFVSGVAQARAAIAAAAEAGADRVELRIDNFDEEKDVRLLIEQSMLPCIVTCRPKWEGGQSELDDGRRIQLLNAVASKAAYIDVELASYRRHPLFDRPVLLSAHDFQGRPEKLNNLVIEMNESRAYVNKIVWTARTIRDNLEAFELLQTRAKPTIALCMGEAGMISRVLAKKFGAFLTFASLSNDSATAPGQVTIGDLKRLYRWDAIGPSTKVFGVVAHPVMHSMSPAIHNAAFDAVGFDGVYLPMLVEGSYESFKAFMESFVNFDGLDLSGLSITLPHKENALRYLKEKQAGVDELASKIGAVNTIVIDRKSGAISLQGMNTDYAAILDSITAKLEISREDLAGLRVAIIGAGGTGRTAVAALAHYGASVFIYNRTREKAELLAKEFDGKRGKVVADWIENIASAGCEVFINTTSVGMHPNVDASPLTPSPRVQGEGVMLPFNSSSVIFDTVYNPMQTKLLRQAEAAGAKTITGVEMFVRQAAAQFEAWTGQPAPRDAMRKIVEDRLRPRA